MDAWIARTHGLICTPRCVGACIDPSHPRSHGVVHRSLYPNVRRDPLKEHDFGRGTWTHWDLNPGPPPCKGGALPLSYGPVRRTGVSSGSSEVLGRPRTRVEPALPTRVGWGEPQSRSVGGDPAADSPTATLLRLKPPCEAQIRPPHGGLIRTSLGCFDGRCVQGAGTYSPHAGDVRLLPNPASCGLKLALMKLDSVVVACQQRAANTSLLLAHTARQSTRVRSG